MVSEEYLPFAFSGSRRLLHVEWISQVSHEPESERSDKISEEFRQEKIESEYSSEGRKHCWILGYI